MDNPLLDPVLNLLSELTTSIVRGFEYTQGDMQKAYYDGSYSNTDHWANHLALQQYSSNPSSSNPNDQLRNLLNQSRSTSTAKEPHSATNSNPNNFGKNSLLSVSLTWTIDSGPTDHMCGPHIKFSNMKLCLSQSELIYPTLRWLLSGKWVPILSIATLLFMM